MVTVAEAEKIISQYTFGKQTERVKLQDAVGRILAQPVVADRDFPPFDRVAMDGIAIGFDEWKNGVNQYAIEDLQAAGQPQKSLEDPLKCMEVMTGAMLPQNTDTVVRYEDLAITGNNVTINAAEIKQFQNIHRKGLDAKSGSQMMSPGQMLAPADIALLATVGLSQVDVFRYPSVALVSTGDELVSIDTQPEDHQIRRSNVFALSAVLREMHIQTTMYHLPDQKEFVIESLRTILASHDVIILSGGVSKGKFDYVPHALEELSVRKLFHEVSQRPGKPMWFGVTESEKVVFALPGNPVSTTVCYYRYIKPWFSRDLATGSRPNYAILATDFRFEPNLTYFLQVKIVNEKGRLMAYPQPGGGSGDLANLKDIDGFIELPRDQATFQAGEVFNFIPIR